MSETAHMSEDVAEVTAEILKENERTLQDLVDVQELLPALKGRPVLAPIVRDAKPEKDSVLQILEYVYKQGQLAITAFLAALNATKESCPQHELALQKLKTAATAKQQSQNSQTDCLLQVLQDCFADIAANIDVTPLLPRLMTQGLVSTENYRDLISPYINQDVRVERILEIIRASGMNGLLGFIVSLREDKTSLKHQHISTLVTKKVQEMVKTNEHLHSDRFLLIKLTSAGIEVDIPTSKDEPTPQDKLFIEITMEHYKTLTQDSKITDLLLSDNGHKENLKSIFKDLGYTIVDFGHILAQYLSNKGYENRVGIITDCVKQHLVPWCHCESVVTVYISGLAFMTKDEVTCLLLQDVFDKSKNMSDCLTDEQLNICLEHLPTKLITVIVDCCWYPPYIEMLPWKQLCRWSTRTVVIATRPKLQVKQQFEEKYERKLTDILTKVLRSWKGDDLQIANHYQLYQTITLHWFTMKTSTASTEPFISGDAERVLFNTGSIPTSLYVYGFTNILSDKKTVSSKIDLRVGTLLGLMQGEEVNVYHVYKPQSLFKAKVTTATKETCVIEILDVEKFQKLIQDILQDQNPQIISYVHVQCTLASEDQFPVIVDVNNKESERQLLSYLDKSPTLRHSTSTQTQLKVKETFNIFEVTDLTGQDKVSCTVSFIDHVKSILERIGRSKYLQSLQCDYTKDLRHYCYIYSIPSDPLLSFERHKQNMFEIDASSSHDGCPPENALCRYEEHKFWWPQQCPAEFQIMFRRSHYITDIELRGHPDSCLPGNYSVKWREKVNLLSGGRYEGPSHVRSSVVIDLKSCDVCAQKQTHCSASEMTITPLKMENTALFCFQLYRYPDEKEVLQFYISDHRQQISPSPNVNGLIEIQSGEYLTLVPSQFTQITLYFTNNHSTPINLSKMIVIHPPNGKSVEIFELAFWNRVNLQPNIQTTDRLISKYSFRSPIVAGNLHIFNLPLVPLQIQVYGSTSPVGEAVSSSDGGELKLLFCNYDKAAVFLTLLCLEQTGSVQVIFSHEKVDGYKDEKRGSFQKFIRTYIPKGCKMDKITDQYRLYVTNNPLYLDSLEQPAVQDYFLEHPYNISKVLPSPHSMNCTEHYCYCYQFQVNVNRLTGRQRST